MDIAVGDSVLFKGASSAVKITPRDVDGWEIYIAHYTRNNF